MAETGKANTLASDLETSAGNGERRAHEHQDCRQCYHDDTPSFSATTLLLASGWGPWEQEEALFSYEPELDTTTRRAAASRSTECSAWRWVPSRSVTARRDMSDRHRRRLTVTVRRPTRMSLNDELKSLRERALAKLVVTALGDGQFRFDVVKLAARKPQRRNEPRMLPTWAK